MSIKKHLRNILPKIVVSIYDNLYYEYIKAFPKRHAAFLYRQFLGRKINWDNPQEFNEKGRWLQFYTDTSKWSVLADKYKVRNYITQKGHKDILVDLYGAWESADDIDFKKLPDSFVLKTNHGCGEIIIVKNKKDADTELIRKQIRKYLNTPYGVQTAEPHYLKIKPMVIAEQLLPNTSEQSSSIIDYKVYCSFGKPFIIAVCYDRSLKNHIVHQTWYDINWEKLDNYHTGGYKTKDIVRPTTLEQMYLVSKDLASEFPFVRMDYYDVNGKLYFGEMTFTSASFSGDELTNEARMELGKAIDITRIPKEMLKK